MHLKEKKLLKKFAATLKKFSAQGAKKVEYGIFSSAIFVRVMTLADSNLVSATSATSFIELTWNSRIFHHNIKICT